MGLDSVELVMAWEEDFGIAITDAEAEKMETVGNAVDLIHQKLRQGVSVSAEEQTTRGILEAIGDPGAALPGETRLADLIPEKGRQQTWYGLRQTLGYSVIPGLRRPCWVSVTGWILAMTAGVLLLPRVGWALAGFALTGILFLLATSRLMRTFPLGSRTVNDLITTIEKQQEIARENQWLDREIVHEKVVQIIVEQLAVKPEQCTDDAKFFADLGCG